ncbi:hypothetical protein MF1_03800 [Bartonella quintana]|nr:hypothetical protein MF1_03800 [Bartonella quintana]
MPTIFGIIKNKLKLFERKAVPLKVALCLKKQNLSKAKKNPRRRSKKFRKTMRQPQKSE